MIYVLEMRSTANWGDVRYREYTTSARKAELFKAVPKIAFTDSGHHIIPCVAEHKGKKLPLNRMLAEHVIDAISEMGRQAAACHCGKNGHPLHSTKCPVHGWEKRSTPRTENLKSEIKAQREQCAQLVEAMITERPWSEKLWARGALAIAARAIRRGRHLTGEERAQNLRAIIAKDILADDGE